MNFSTESFVGHGILPKQLELRRSISTWQRIDVTLPWKSRAPARLWRRRFQNESSLVSQSNHRSCGRFTEWARNYHCPWILYVPDTICSLNWRWRKFCIRDIQVTHRSLLDDSKACWGQSPILSQSSRCIDSRWPSGWRGDLDLGEDAWI